MSDLSTCPAGSPVVARVFDHDRVWRLDAEVFDVGARLLACHEPRPDLVVGIARGGLPLADRLAACFGVESVAVTARHNHSDELYVAATGRVDLAEPGPAVLQRLRRAGAVLVADDICGTGATMSAVLGWLPRHLAPGAELRTTVLCRSAAATQTPDSWLWDTRDWVVFPWNDPTDQPTEPLPLPAEVRGGQA